MGQCSQCNRPLCRRGRSRVSGWGGCWDPFDAWPNRQPGYVRWLYRKLRRHFIPSWSDAETMGRCSKWDLPIRNASCQTFDQTAGSREHGVYWEYVRLHRQHPPATGPLQCSQGGRFPSRCIAGRRVGWPADSCELHQPWLYSNFLVCQNSFPLDERIRNWDSPYCRTRKILDENPDLREKWTSLIPVGSMGTPENLMGPVTFLLSDASGYITGTDLRVDGGYTLTWIGLCYVCRN